MTVELKEKASRSMPLAQQSTQALIEKQEKLEVKKDFMFYASENTHYNTAISSVINI